MDKELADMKKKIDDATKVLNEQRSMIGQDKKRIKEREEEKNPDDEKEITELKEKIAQAEEKLLQDMQTITTDKEHQKKLEKEVEEKNSHEKKITELRKKIGTAKKEARESKQDQLLFDQDSQATPTYDLLLDYDREKLKRLEEETYRKPDIPELSRVELAVWKFFLPTSYSYISFSELHTLPYMIREPWAEYKRDHVFKDFEIRGSRTGAYLQYFALFGIRDTKYWLIAEWTGSPIYKPPTQRKREKDCLEQMQWLQRVRAIRFGTAIVSVIASGISLWLENFLLSILLASICIALWATYKTLHTEFSLEEERDLLGYLKKQLS